MTQFPEKPPGPKDVHGRPGYHDPTYRMAGAAPARSALTLRLVLSCLALALCGLTAAIFAVLGEPTWKWVLLGLVASTAAVDMAVIVRRKRRGEPG